MSNSWEFDDLVSHHGTNDMLTSLMLAPVTQSRGVDSKSQFTHHNVSGAFFPSPGAVSGLGGHLYFHSRDRAPVLVVENMRNKWT